MLVDNLRTVPKSAPTNFLERVFEQGTAEQGLSLGCLQSGPDVAETIRVDRDMLHMQSIP